MSDKLKKRREIILRVLLVLSILAVVAVEIWYNNKDFTFFWSKYNSV